MQRRVRRLPDDPLTLIAGKSTALEYAAVIETLSQHFTLLPMRFGSLMDSDEAIIHMLERNYHDIQQNHLKIDDKFEFGLKVFCDSETLMAELREKSEAASKTQVTTVAEIRNSLFVVAEVTEHKRVVYFEAGYAIGRNLPVIWCVQKDDLDNVHFDTRHYNHVVWKTTDELKEKLYDMICALVGRRKKI